ncbi:MAG: triphosphoribosyl-dephospho-CoA synthase, partial [Streptococcaceae bacterium]|nr:triphosphoribosyl-dephospho-CoA synthase [Streptococcaceae bacterium]
MLKKVANFAQKALYYEVALTPKPGLVDRLDNGSHADMNFYTFIESIQALSPFFEQYVEAGFHHDGDLPDLFHKIRKIGVQAEKQMLVATNQINTHKGAN